MTAFLTPWTYQPLSRGPENRNEILQTGIQFENDSCFRFINELSCRRLVTMGPQMAFWAELVWFQTNLLLSGKLI